MIPAGTAVPKRPGAPELDFESHLPAGRQWFRIDELAGYLQVSNQHVINLVTEGRFDFGENCHPVNLSGVPNKTRATTRIPRACVVAFLRANRQ